MTHPPSREIRVLLLDADGVIQTSSGEFLSSIAALCANPDQRGAFIEDVFLAEKPCLAGESDFAEALTQVLARWNINTPTSDALKLWNQIRPVSEMLDVVSRLRSRGIRVCLATNQQQHRANIMADGLGYSSRFDHMFFSYQLGVAKPEPEFFTKILDRLGIPGSHALFIDDHSRNVAGAQTAGLVGEVYHIDHGFAQFVSILERYGLPIA